MRILITLVFLATIRIGTAQECAFFPEDQFVCGFEVILDFEDDGSISTDCASDVFISLTESNDSTIISFSSCGEYTLIHTDADDCVDSLMIFVDDPSTSVTAINTQIGLSYGDIDCPDNVNAGCDGEGSVTIVLPGIPDPVWDFCSSASCVATTYTCNVVGGAAGCIVDSIACTSTMVTDNSAQECVASTQFDFITLNSDGTGVDQNTFLEYLAQLQGELGIDCPIVNSSCDSYFAQMECTDSTRLDTSYLEVPVRLGGQWTFPWIDTLVLQDTTYFTYQSSDYELILEPGVDFYGPGELDVLFNSVFFVGGDTIRENPYGVTLELLWVEDWILDSIEVVRQVPVETDSSCVGCGGNFFSSTFDLPGIPSFPCGAVSIYYPDVCECEDTPLNYSVQVIGCEDRTWLIEVYDAFWGVQDVYGANYTADGNLISLSNPYDNNVIISLFDSYGCVSYINLELELGIEFFEIYSESSVLSCGNPSINLLADGNLDLLEIYNINVIWELPAGETIFGHSITVSEPGLYTAIYDDGQGCSYSQSTTITYVDMEETTYMDVVLCGDESVEVHGEIISAAGSYTIEDECNIVEVTASQFEITNDYVYYEVCEGEPIILDGQEYYSGIHTIQEDNGTPCPGELVLEVQETIIETNVDISYFCEGWATLALTHSNGSGVINILQDGQVVQSTQSEGEVSINLMNVGDYTVQYQVAGCDIELPVSIATIPEYPEVAVPTAIHINCSDEFDLVTEADVTYMWQLPSGDDVAHDELMLEQEGQYTLTATNNFGCTTTAIMMATMIDTDVDVAYDCDGLATISLSHDSGDGLISIHDGDQIVQSINSTGVAVTEISESGNYMIQFLIADCLIEKNLEIDASPSYPSVDIPTVLSINCSNDFELIEKDDESYMWQLPSGTLVSHENLTMEDPGQYTLTVTNDQGCTTVAHMDVEITVPIALEYSTTIACEDKEDGRLTIEEISGGVGPYTIYIDGQEAESMTTSIGGGQHTVQVLQADGCMHEESFFVEIQLDLELTADHQELEFCNHQGVSVTMPPEEGLSYKWSDGHPEVDRIFTEAGTHELLVSDQCSEVTLTYDIVDARVERSFAVANIISAGSTNGNSLLKVIPKLDYRNYHHTIYSRSGSLVFDSRDVDDQWNGNFNGSQVVPGVYVWVIEAEVADCFGMYTPEVITGTVVVIP